ncbi:hypothetical protein EV121DRAFT_288451 [Schizophyllum commune]
MSAIRSYASATESYASVIDSSSSQHSACESGAYRGSCQSASCAGSRPLPPASDLCDTLDFDDDDFLDAPDRPDVHVSCAPLDTPLIQGDSQAPSDRLDATPSHASQDELSASQSSTLVSQEAAFLLDEAALDLDEPDRAMDEVTFALPSGASSAHNALSDRGGAPCALSEVTLPVNCDSLSLDGVNSTLSALSPPPIALTHHSSALTPPLSSPAPPLSGPGLALNVATSRIL